MLLPQSSAFAALKNRLNSVSAIGYLHIAPRAYVQPFLFHLRQVSTEVHLASTPPTPTTAFDRPNRLKAREDGAIRWAELFEKFRSVQDKAKRIHKLHNQVEDGNSGGSGVSENSKEKALPEISKQTFRPSSAGNIGPRPSPPGGPAHKPKSGLGNFGRLTSSVGSRKAKK